MRGEASTFSEHRKTQGIRLRMAPPISAKSSAGPSPSGAQLPAADGAAAPAGPACCRARASCRRCRNRRAAGFRAGGDQHGIHARRARRRAGPTAARRASVHRPRRPGAAGRCRARRGPREELDRPCRPRRRADRRPPARGRRGRRGRGLGLGQRPGRAAKAASKSAPCAAKAERAGMSSAKSPPSGMQTSLHTSQSARSFTLSVSPA